MVMADPIFCFIHVKSQFWDQIHYFPSSNFFLLHYPGMCIQFTLYYLLSGRLQEFKNKRKFYSFSSKSGRRREREVFAFMLQ